MLQRNHARIRPCKSSAATQTRAHSFVDLAHFCTRLRDNNGSLSPSGEAQVSFCHALSLLIDAALFHRLEPFEMFK